nr:hypothetical protein [Tanacetum cinerariifolium]
RSGDVSPGVDGPPVMSEDPYAYVVAAFQALPSWDYEEEPSGNDADEEDEEQDEDNDDEEEEHPASADSILAPSALRLLSSDRRADRPEVTLPPQKRLSIVYFLGYEVGESSAAAAARPIEGHRVDYRFVGSVEAEI